MEVVACSDVIGLQSKHFIYTYNLSFDENWDSIHLFKELFAQPKLGIFRGILGYGLGGTKSVDTPVS